jgi:DNA-directed RNA polymerase subunit L
MTFLWSVSQLKARLSKKETVFMVHYRIAHAQEVDL